MQLTTATQVQSVKILWVALHVLAIKATTATESTVKVSLHLTCVQFENFSTYLLQESKLMNYLGTFCHLFQMMRMNSNSFSPE